MWICPDCKNENRDVKKQCDSCGYTREAATNSSVPVPAGPSDDVRSGTPEGSGGRGTTTVIVAPPEPQPRPQPRPRPKPQPKPQPESPPEPQPAGSRHYLKEATRLTPALIIYLIDVSASMSEAFETKTKIHYVNQALRSTLRRMVQRSTRGDAISPRYQLAMATYSDHVFDFIGGVKTIDEVARKGSFTLSPQFGTNTYEAFNWALNVLREALPASNGKPAPMVCHLTDGQYTTGDPEPIAKDIMKMSNDDGFVLVENIYMGPDLTAGPISVADSWPGIMDVSELRNDYAKKLFRMSSPLPASYAEEINREGYAVRPGCRMLIPGSSSELVELAFAMSGATHVG